MFMQEDNLQKNNNRLRKRYFAASHKGESNIVVKYHFTQPNEKALTKAFEILFNETVKSIADKPN